MARRTQSNNLLPFLQRFGSPLQQQEERPMLPVNKFVPDIPLKEANLTNPNDIPAPKAPDFMGQYAKLAANRPQRLAYQQAVEGGAPQIERGKWAKLGALVAAGATGFGKQDAEAGARLGLSSYNEPQRKSDEAYKERITGLGNLANMEDSDVQQQMKMLEMQNSDWYNKEQLRLQQRGAGLAERSEDRQQQESDRNYKLAQANSEANNWIPRTDPNDGNMKIWNRITNEERVVGSAALTTQQQIDAKVKETTEQARALQPFQIAEYNREQGGRREIANINARAMTGRNDADNRTRIQVALMEMQKARETAGIKPGEKADEVLNDISQAMASDPLLQGKSMRDYISMTGAPGNYVIDVNPDSRTPMMPWTGDDAETKVIKDRIRQIISNSYNRINGINGQGGLNGLGRQGGPGARGPGNTPAAQPPRMEGLPEGFSERQR